MRRGWRRVLIQGNGESPAAAPPPAAAAPAPLTVAPETFGIDGVARPVEEKKTVCSVTYYKVDGAWYSR